MIERAAEGICACHPVPEFPFLQFTIWNEQMTHITGYTLEVINRRGWYQTMYPDPENQRRAVQRMDEMRQGRDLLAEEWHVTHASGQPRILLMSTCRLEGVSGSGRGIALMTDITERRRR